MGRKAGSLRLTNEQRRQVNHALATASPREKERLKVIMAADRGAETLEKLARKAERARSTIQSWIKAFQTGGLRGLLREESRGGSKSPINDPEVYRQLAAGIEQGRWQSASEIVHWLKSEHGIVRARKTIYYWVGKCRKHT